MHRVWMGITLLAGLMLAACEPVATPTLSPGVGGGATEVVEPMQINDVQVIRTGADTGLPQPAAVIEGLIGDSCNALDSVTQSRDANVISIQINVRRTTDPNEACAELAQMYNETLPLEGEFPPGDYTLLVNGTARTFSIAAQPTSTPDCSSDSELIEDVTFPNGSPVAGGEPFVKTWRVRNSGTCPWNSSFELVKVEGDAIFVEPSGLESTPLPDAQPGAEAEASVKLIVSLGAPLNSLQSARFQMRTPDGGFFGPQLLVQVSVAESTADAAAGCMFDSEFVEDVTIPDGSPVVAGEPFVKTWRIRNTGTCPWDETFQLVQIEGDTIALTSGTEPIPLPKTAPGEVVEISVELVMSLEAPVGSEQKASFQIRAPDGNLFGTHSFVLVTVAESE